MFDKNEVFNYLTDQKYSAQVAYFSMEYAIDQSLKIYSGGLGFLAGSHLRSAYALKQNLLGIGILWKYGYYDQQRDEKALLKPAFVEKNYSFLTDTGIVFTAPVHGTNVHVKAYFLQPYVFGTAPLFLLSTDIEQNDYLSQTITHRLYDPNEATRVAQSIILGTGGATLLDALDLTPDVYHMNEGHSVSLNFYLYAKYKSLEEVKKRVVFTTHTPEMAGNEEHSYRLLNEMSFFFHLQEQEVKSLLQLDGVNFNYTMAALKFARKANGVSQLHGNVARNMWKNHSGICPIISITNAQNKSCWEDPELRNAITTGNDNAIISGKKHMKQRLFKVVADQCGKLFDENVLTIVWARRFASYKRADLLMLDWNRFVNLITNTRYPVQIIWAGKPYPEDLGAIGLFNQIVTRTKPFSNCAVLTGYELELSALLKKGADVWLNTPRMYHEASGTSGMTAAMNGAINVSIPDGWVPEFARDKENCFIIQPAAAELSDLEKDKEENRNLLNLLEEIVLPVYYTNSRQWLNIIKRAAEDISPQFESARLAEEYYSKLYNS